MVKVCPSCGKECGQDHSFCPYCGTYVPQPDICLACGHEFMEGHAFCPHCGNARNSQEEVTPFAPQPNTCPSCGHELLEGHAFCAHCGARKKDKNTIALPSYCPYCGNELRNGTSFCSYCGNDATSSPKTTTYHKTSGISYTARTPVSSAPQEGMAWYKFIIYFQLFAASVGSFISAISLISSDIFEMLSKYVDGFDTLRFFYFAALIALGVDALVTRSALANYKEKGPKLYIKFVLSNAIISLIYVIWLSALLDDYRYTVDNSFTIITIITNFVMAFINWIYFSKREHLFVN